VHPIEGVATSIAAFLGATKLGPVNAPVLVRSFLEFQAQFGGLAEPFPLTYAVQQFFTNGGREALIARVEPSGATLADSDLSNATLQSQKRGLWMLDHAESFNILCIPPLTRTTDVGRATWDTAIAYAKQRDAMVVVDPPAAWSNATDVTSGLAALVKRSSNAALYFPRLQAPDPLRANQVTSFAPSGAIAGIYARIDQARGIWRAPAGAEAKIIGAASLSVTLNDDQIGLLNPLGVNCLRNLPGTGLVVWGGRTLADTGAAGEELYRYIPVRRMESYIAASIKSSLGWALFEPNDEPLWARVRASVTAFLYDLWRRGALQGAKPEQAFFVRCDRDTTTQLDIDLGRLNLIVGFAPLKPAEFVVISLGSLLAHEEAMRFLSRYVTIDVGRYGLSVMWDGQEVAGVAGIRGLSQLTELVSRRDGADPNGTHIAAGRTKYDPITLTRGLGQDEAFAAWAKLVGAGGSAAVSKDVRIEIYDRARRRKFAWRLIGALPVKHDVPEFTMGSDTATEELVLAYERLERE